MKSELLYREAQDDFFYFNKINSAYKKLKLAVSLTPWHLKSIILLADICFIKGYTRKSLNLYKNAAVLSPQNAKIIAGIANCLSSLSYLDEAILYCNKAICFLTPDDYSLFSQIFELKMNILLSQKKYKTAYNELSSAKNILDWNSLKNYEMLNEKINRRKKLIQSNLQIISVGEK